MQRAPALRMRSSNRPHVAAIAERIGGAKSNQGIIPVKLKSVIAGVLFAFLAVPLAAQAQGVPGGAAHGFHEGGRIAGPVGAVVGTAVGGVIGGVEGVLGVNHQHVAHSGPYAEHAPRRHYRHHRAHRAKAKHHRRARHSRRHMR
jgi:hypothetical protein